MPRNRKEYEASEAYVAALDAHDTAMALYDAAVKKYRAGGCSGEYLRARNARDVAHGEFDQACALEQRAQTAAARKRDNADSTDQIAFSF